MGTAGLRASVVDGAGDGEAGSARTPARPPLRGDPGAVAARAGDRHLRLGRSHPWGQALAGRRIRSPVPEDGSLDDFEAAGRDQPGSGLRAPRVRLERDHQRRDLTGLPRDDPYVLRCRLTEGRILECGGTCDEERVTEDQLQTVVVRQVGARAQPQPSGTPFDNVPVPP
ncbi:hypothetical protein KPATCC21470_1911 [Kitasatospora purpeofusca]